MALHAPDSPDDEDDDDPEDARMVELLSELSPCNYAALLRLRAILTWFGQPEPHDLNIPGWMVGRAHAAHLAIVGHMLHFPPEQGHGDDHFDVACCFGEARSIAALVVETLERFLEEIPLLPAPQKAPIERLLATYLRLPLVSRTYAYEDELPLPEPSPEEIAQARKHKN